MQQPTLSTTSMVLHGVPIQFPLQPYRSQVLVMRAVVRSLLDETHAILESPTGTGKSLALLCAALAWLRAHTLKQPLDDDDVAHGQVSPHEQRPVKMYVIRFFLAETIRFYATRTHKQIAQVVGELQRTAYTSVKMTILSSREQTCLQSFAPGANKNEECKRLLDSRSGCSFYDNVRALWQAPRLQHGVWDIEDLMALGRTKGGCAHYAARALLEDATLVFCPYNYLLDPVTRKQMKIALVDHVVILDEAHNIEVCTTHVPDTNQYFPHYIDVAREVASMTVTLSQLSDLAERTRDVETFLSSTTPATAAQSQSGTREYKGTMASVLDALVRLVESVSDGPDPATKTWTGPEGAKLLEGAGISTCTIADIHGCFSTLEKAYMDAASKAPPSLDLATLERLMIVCTYFLGNDGAHIDDYIVVLRRGGVAEDMSAEVAAPPQHVSLSLCCLNSAIAARALRDARSVLLSSGTLAPLTSFASELDIPFASTVEAGHVIPPEQLWTAAWAFGPTQRRISCTQQYVGSYELQDDIAAVLLQVCRVVPFGVLVFAPSYGLLERLLARWRTTGALAALAALKTIVVEPRGADALHECLHTYYSAIAEAERAAGVPVTAGGGGAGAHDVDDGDDDHVRAAGLAVSNPAFHRWQYTKRRFGGPFKRARRIQSVERASGGGASSATHSATTGGLFFAVARGKVSEGLNFADNNCRAVVNIGIPFPPCKDEVVRAKQMYNDKHARTRGLLDGRSWYDIAAFRALNQGLGRCIRHRADWAAVILLDERFYREEKYVQQLPLWVRQNIRRPENFDACAAGLAAFVAERSSVPSTMPTLLSTVAECGTTPLPETMADGGLL